MMMKACPKVGCVWREYCLHSVDHNKLPHCDIESNFCPACKPVRQKPEKVKPKYRYKIVLAGWPGVKTTTTTICAGCGVKYGLHDAFSLECPDGSGVFSKRVRVKIEPKQTKKGGSMAQNRYVIKQEPEPVKPKLVELEQHDIGVDIKVDGKYVLNINNDGNIYRYSTASGTGLKTYSSGRVRIKGMRDC